MSTSNQSLEVVGTKTIDQIRKDGIYKQLKERIAAERAEMQHIKDQVKERLPGQFLSLRQDIYSPGNGRSCKYRRRTMLQQQQEIPGKMVNKWRFQVYDMTSFDPNNHPEPAIWERGMTEADQVLYWLEQGVTELTIMRNGGPNSKSTTYNIFPANR